MTPEIDQRVIIIARITVGLNARARKPNAAHNVIEINDEAIVSFTFILTHGVLIGDYKKKKEKKRQEDFWKA